MLRCSVSAEFILVSVFYCGLLIHASCINFENFKFRVVHFSVRKVVFHSSKCMS